MNILTLMYNNITLYLSFISLLPNDTYSTALLPAISIDHLQQPFRPKNAPQGIFQP